MKTILIRAVILCSAAAFGQVGASALSNQVAPLQMVDHPQHASTRAWLAKVRLSGEDRIRIPTLRGERPLWEFGTVSQPVPLGDVARAYRKEKLTGKKAELVLEKQGS